jgi:hypothetical protein
MLISKVIGISLAIASVIKISAMYLPTFNQIDQNTMAVTAISIPVVIFAAVLLARG